MEMFMIEVALGATGSLKPGDVIEQGIVQEIHFVGINGFQMVIMGSCQPQEATLED